MVNSSACANAMTDAMDNKIQLLYSSMVNYSANAEMQ
jgi:hypothetical protein